MAAIRGFLSNVGDVIVGAGKKIGDTVEQGIQGVGDGVAAFGKAIKDLSETVVARSASPPPARQQQLTNEGIGPSTAANDAASGISNNDKEPSAADGAHGNVDAGGLMKGDETAVPPYGDRGSLPHHPNGSDLEETYFYAYVTKPRDSSARSPAVVPVGHELRVFVVPLHEDRQSNKHPATQTTTRAAGADAAAASSAVPVAVDGTLTKILLDPQIPFGLRMELRNYVAEPNVVLGTPLVVVAYEEHSHHLELSSTLLSMASGNDLLGDSGFPQPISTDAASSAPTRPSTYHGLCVRVKWFTQSHPETKRNDSPQHHIHHAHTSSTAKKRTTTTTTTDWRTVALFEHGPRRAHWYPTEEAKLHLLLEDRLGARLAIEDIGGPTAPNNTSRSPESPTAARGEGARSRHVSSAKRSVGTSHHLELYALSPRQQNGHIVGSRPASGESGGSSFVAAGQKRRPGEGGTDRGTSAATTDARTHDTTATAASGTAGVAAARPLRREVSAEFPVVVRPPRQAKAQQRPATGNSVTRMTAVAAGPPPLAGQSRETCEPHDAATTSKSGSARRDLSPHAPSREQIRVGEVPPQSSKPPLPLPSASGAVSTRLYREQTTDPRLVAASLRRRWELLDDERQNFDVYLERAAILDSLFLDS